MFRTGSDRHKPFLLIEGTTKQCAPPTAARQMGEVFRASGADQALLWRRNTKGDQHLWGEGARGASQTNPEGTKWDYRVPSGMGLLLP